MALNNYYKEIKSFDMVFSSNSKSIGFIEKNNKQELINSIAGMYSVIEKSSKTQITDSSIVFDTCELLVSEYPLATLADIGLFFRMIFTGKFKIYGAITCMNLLENFSKYWQDRINYAENKSYTEHVSKKHVDNENAKFKDILKKIE